MVCNSVSECLRLGGCSIHCSIKDGVFEPREATESRDLARGKPLLFSEELGDELGVECRMRLGMRLNCFACRLLPFREDRSR